MRHAWLPLCLFALACPERATPDRGVMLVFKKPSRDSVRANVDRRLAHLKLKAHLQEDDARLTIRIRDGEVSDLEVIKRLISFPGELSFCPEDVSTAEAWCSKEVPESVSRETSTTTCALSSPKQSDLDALFPDGGTTDVVFEHSTGRHVAYAVVHDKCLTPRVVGVERTKAGGDEPNLMLDFDKSTSAEFATLTTALVKKRLIIVLDGKVRGAPMILEPLTAGRAGLLLEGGEDATLLGAVLVGGPLPKLELEKESRYGPPSLR